MRPPAASGPRGGWRARRRVSRGGMAGLAHGAAGPGRRAARVRAVGRRGPPLAALFPEPPHVRADQGAAAYRAWTERTPRTSIRTTRSSAGRSGEASSICACSGMMAPSQVSATSRPASLVRDPVRPGRDHHRAPVLPFVPDLAGETLRVLAERQATTVDHGGTEPGKILHELRPARWPGPERCRTRPITARGLDAAVARPPRRNVRLDRRPRARRSALAERPGGARVDRPLGRPRRRRFVEYERRTEAACYNQGWKDSRRRIRDRRRRHRVAPIALAEVQGYVYDAKRRMARLARLRGETDLADRLEVEAAELRSAVRRRVLGRRPGYYAMALDGDKRPVGRDRLERWATASGAGSWRRSGRRQVADRLLDPRCTPAGGFGPTRLVSPGTTRRLPHRDGLAARQLDRAAGMKRYGFHDEANRLVDGIFEAAQRLPGLPRCRSCSAASTRPAADSRSPTRSPARRRPGPPAPVPVPPDDAGPARQRPRRESRALAAAPAHVARQASRSTNLRVGDAAVDLLFHRWRGTTSAEVLRKVGDIEVVIRV